MVTIGALYFSELSEPEKLVPVSLQFLTDLVPE